MISAIFQPEVTTLESQVLALQAQIAAAQQRITLLNDAETLAGGSLDSLKAAIEKVSSLAPSAIASLKSAVLGLFQGGDSNNDGNDDQPIDPAPQPNNDGGVDAAITVEILTGQSTEWACPLASPLTCSIDVVAIPPVVEQKPYIELVPVGHAVAYQHKLGNDEIVCCYLGGNNKSRLKDWGSWLCNQHSVGSGFELREANRLTAFKYEIKLWGMILDAIKRLAETDTTKSPGSNYGNAPGSKAAELTEVEIAIAVDSIQPPAPSAAGYLQAPIGRAGAAKNWGIYQAYKAEQRASQTAVLDAPPAAPAVDKIVVGDWVELLVNGDRLQVEEVDAAGIHLVTDDGNTTVQADEIKLLLHVPDSWKPF